MNLFCKRCNINWARVYTCCHDDDSYDYCPECGSDMDLVAGAQGIDAFIKNPITGAIISVNTKKILQLKSTGSKLFNEEKKALKKAGANAKNMLKKTAETTAIDAYLAHVGRNKAKARRLYFTLVRSA